MKIMFSSKRHHYLAIVSIFLITVALIAGMVGCDGGVSYALAIASTEGGSVTTPGEGMFTYDEGMVVDLVAEPEEGYQFVNWTGDVSAITDVNAAATNITMNGHYYITANFASENLEIWNWYDLDAVRNNLGGNHTLMNDLDSTTAGYTELASETANQGQGWQPIEALSGSFNGQGYEIRDLFINRPSESGVGLFRYVAEAGVVEDIGMVNATVTGGYAVGSLVGWNRGTVTDFYAAGMVTGDDQWAGGLVEWNDSVVGGLVGDNNGAVSNSYFTGSVTGQGWVGGLVGQNGGTVSNSYSSAEVVGSDRLVGGLVGASGGTVSNSYFTGSVTGEYDVGGLVGMSVGTVSNSYAKGSVTGDYGVGGLVGGIGGIDDYGRICAGVVSNCYSTGSVTGTYGVGGLISGGMEYGATVSNSFWDIETSGTTASDGGTGKTTAEMKNFATFSGAAWDIIAVALNQTNPAYIWNIVHTLTYPFLSWEP